MLGSKPTRGWNHFGGSKNSSKQFLAFIFMRVVLIIIKYEIVKLIVIIILIIIKLI